MGKALGRLRCLLTTVASEGALLTSLVGFCSLEVLNRAPHSVIALVELRNTAGACHRIKWLSLEVSLKPIQFQCPAVGRIDIHQILGLDQDGVMDGNGIEHLESLWAACIRAPPPSE